MNAASFALILVGVLLNAAAQLLLKAGTGVTGELSPNLGNLGPMARIIVTNPHFLGGFACYAVSVVIWIVALSRVPVSIAYPMPSIGYVVNALAARSLFAESLAVSGWLGIGFIIVGVWLLTGTTAAT